MAGRGTIITSLEPVVGRRGYTRRRKLLRRVAFFERRAEVTILKRLYPRVFLRSWAEKRGN